MICKSLKTRKQTLSAAYITALMLVLCFAISFLSISDALAQSDAPKVLSIMGKAEIKSSGRSREAKTGDLIQPGESVEL
ncbi:MAG: hypothetical protein LBE27_03970, partial [Deltaproteobacteria bacterium]|nr:hypothetical protein [Deltaproteobacteria bacterium]